jgi:Flp pilus assembly protein TadG
MKTVLKNSIRIRLGKMLGGTGMREAGQSLVELALVTPLLVIVLVATVEFGRMAYAKIAVTNAARAGVAYGAQNVFKAVDLTGMQNAALNDGADIAGWKTNAFTATASKFCMCSNGNQISCASAATSCMTPNRSTIYVEVDTQVNVNSMFSFAGLPSTYTVNGKAIMRVQQ